VVVTLRKRRMVVLVVELQLVAMVVVVAVEFSVPLLPHCLVLH